MGFGTSNTPYAGPNAIAKYKERKTNKLLLLFGEGIDSQSGARGQARTPWEGDVLLNFDALCYPRDVGKCTGLCLHTTIDTPTVDHPVLMTERLCSPLHSRALTSELMFELYSVPSLTYCVDGIMSFYQNNLSPPSQPFSAKGLVLSFNTASTSVIPILRGKGLLGHAKRIPWGASQSSEYLLKLIQLKYPNFPTRVTTTQTNWMLHNFCEVATDFSGCLRQLRDASNMRASEVVLQLPFTVPQGKKLQEMAAKTRMEKLLQKENDLQYLTNLKETKATENKKEWMSKSQAENLDNEAALDETIKLEDDLKKVRKKDAGEADNGPQEEPSFPLIDLPDADTNSTYSLERKEREKEEREREEKKVEEERDMDLGGWARKLRLEHEFEYRVFGCRRPRAQGKEAERRWRRAISNPVFALRSDLRPCPAEDMFGADDADWAIYRKINTAAPSSDEEDDLSQLQLIEQKLLTHDPTFTNKHTHASIAIQQPILLYFYMKHWALPN
ncbi:hypothetical protein GALMADRAFT_145269 [Galerina marginata CBS 339.88]|uniref:Actin-related protein 5 n=1 Tax=Galerina marginata (strain CBS 339.88) TaxID=685588 RepID=A0A067SG28_GALM3|nr:hypothetical protein GALMADRAFT_145269 [Galerina marginata CBS 339.88]